MKNLYFLILSLFVTGCSTSYVQKSPEWNPNTPQKTLLGYYKLKKVEKGGFSGQKKGAKRCFFPKKIQGGTLTI